MESTTDLANKLFQERPDEPMLVIGRSVARTLSNGALATLEHIAISAKSILQLHIVVRGAPFNPPEVPLPAGDYSAAIEAFRDIKLGDYEALRAAADISTGCATVHDAILLVACK
jgi:hypothetical protein